MLILLLTFAWCCFKDLLQRARITKGQEQLTAISSSETRTPAQNQQQQREVLRQLAAEHSSSYDSAGERLELSEETLMPSGFIE